MSLYSPFLASLKTGETTFTSFGKVPSTEKYSFEARLITNLDLLSFNSLRIFLRLGGTFNPLLTENAKPLA